MCSGIGFAAAQMAGLSSLAAMQGLGAQFVNQGSLRGSIGSGLGLFAPSPLTFKQEMQRDVNAWLKDWDADNE